MIQFCWLSISSWIVVYVLTLEADQQISWVARCILRYKHIFGWGIPATLVGVMFGLSPEPTTEGGYKCWFRGSFGKDLPMWTINLVVAIITIGVLSKALVSGTVIPGIRGHPLHVDTFFAAAAIASLILFFITVG